MELPFESGRLRPLREDDIPAMVRGLDDREVWKCLRDRVPHPYRETDARAFLTALATKSDSVVFGIESEGRLCGAVGVHRFDDIRRLTAELGFWIARSEWRRGIASRAVPVAVAHAFAHWPDLERIEAQVFAENVVSQHVVRKLGFVLEGTLRRAVVKDGVVQDLLMYAKLRNDA